MDWKCVVGGVALGKRGTTSKQAAILRRHGIPVPFSKAKASRLIGELKEKERAKDFALEKRINEEIKQEKMKLALLERELLAQKTKQREAELAELKKGRENSKDRDLSR